MHKFYLIVIITCLPFLNLHAAQPVGCVSLWVDIKLLTSPKTVVKLYHCEDANKFYICGNQDCSDRMSQQSLDDDADVGEQAADVPCQLNMKPLDGYGAIQLYEKYCMIR